MKHNWFGQYNFHCSDNINVRVWWCMYWVCLCLRMGNVRGEHFAYTFRSKRFFFFFATPLLLLFCIDVNTFSFFIFLFTFKCTQIQKTKTPFLHIYRFHILFAFAIFYWCCCRWYGTAHFSLGRRKGFSITHINGTLFYFSQFSTYSDGLAKYFEQMRYHDDRYLFHLIICFPGQVNIFAIVNSICRKKRTESDKWEMIITMM